jgi:hypothetical protein
MERVAAYAKGDLDCEMELLEMLNLLDPNQLTK